VFDTTSVNCLWDLLLSGSDGQVIISWDVLQTTLYTVYKLQYNKDLCSIMVITTVVVLITYQNVSKELSTETLSY